MTPLGEAESDPDFLPPDWYPLVRAARYLGVPPWELQNQPIWWWMWAMEAEQAEAHAEAVHIERAKQKQKAKKRK